MPAYELVAVSPAILSSYGGLDVRSVRTGDGVTESKGRRREERYFLCQLRAPWAVLARRVGCLMAAAPTWPCQALTAQIQEAHQVASYLHAVAVHDPDAGRFLL